MRVVVLSHRRYLDLHIDRYRPPIFILPILREVVHLSAAILVHLLVLMLISTVSIHGPMIAADSEVVRGDRHA